MRKPIDQSSQQPQSKSQRMLEVSLWHRGAGAFQYRRQRQRQQENAAATTTTRSPG